MTWTSSGFAFFFFFFFATVALTGSVLSFTDPASIVPGLGTVTTTVAFPPLPPTGAPMVKVLLGSIRAL